MVERIPITQSYVSSLKATGTDQYIRDTRLVGFGVRVNPGGKVVFQVEGRVKRGKPVRVSLGNADTLTVTEARSLAQEPLKLMAEGIDPRKHRVEAEAAEQRAKAKDQALAVTLQSVFDDYLVKRTLKPKTSRDYLNTVNLYFADWLTLPIRDISRKKVEQRYVELRDNTGLATANKAMTILKAICAFAAAEDIEGEQLLGSNPVSVLRDKKIRKTLPARIEHLNDHQIHKILHYAETVRSWPTAESFVATQTDGVTAQGLNYILLLLFTGLRKGEGLALRWQDVDMVKKTFTCRDTKNGTNHFVPMSIPVHRLFIDQRQIAGNSPWVFPSPGSASGHMTEPKTQLQKIIKATEVSFRLHDLRRTFGTHAAQQGMERQAISRALNHSKQDVTESYIQGTVDLIRPVFDAVAKVYYQYFDEDLKRYLFEPEAYAAAEAEHAQHMKETGEKQGTPTSF